MRGHWLVIAAMCAAGGSVACGSSKKEAKDPTDEHPASSDEVPKWEGASSAPPEKASKSSSGGSSSGSGTSTAGSSGGSVHEAEKKRTDQDDKEGTEIALNRAARQVKANCGQAKDENGKAIGPWGKVTVNVQLGHNGHSKGITVPPPYQGKPVGTCIERAFTNLSFPPWAGADTEVPWEVELVEPGKEGKK
jgi:hypothetical protein